jgi:hypothetical protein
MYSRRWSLRLLAVSLIAAATLTAATVDASAATLSKRRAEKAAFRLVKKVGQQGGAAVWWAGHCKRKSPRKFACWGAVVDGNGDGAAQKIRVTLRHGKVKARRVGKVYYGNVSDEYQQHNGNGGEWAVCGIHQSVCVGS